MAKAKKHGSQVVHDLDEVLAASTSHDSWYLHFIKKTKSVIVEQNKKLRKLIRTKREERLTIMFIPHNEKSIRNYHISNLSLTIMLTLLTAVVVTSAVLIINHTSTVQDVIKYKISQKDAKVQFSKIRDEIQSIASTYDLIKGSLGKLYSLSSGKKNSETLFARGGAEVSLQETIGVGDITEHSDENNAEKIPDEIFMLNRILNDMEISEKPLKEIEKFIQSRTKIIKNTPTLWPVKGYIINPFGMIRNSLNYHAEFNTGIDIAANPGSEVLATAPGVVVGIRQDNRYNYQITIRHNFGYITKYRGLDRITISNDDKVTKGDTIGYLGTTTDSMESVLHYEIFIGVDAQDPMPYISFVAN